MRLRAAALLLLCFACPASADTIRVGVAVSLKEAVTEIARGYEARTGDTIRFTFGSSGQVMAQIKAGADIDAFISAADKQVDELDADGLLEPGTRRAIAGNTLVLVVARDAAASVDSFESLAGPAVKRVAVGEPKTVPAGQYALEVLKKLELTDALAGRLVYGSHVRQVLDYVARGEVTAGIVYATDAKQVGDKVKVVAAAPKGSHGAIVYPAVVLKKSKSATAARRFLDHLNSGEARKALTDRGFTVPEAKERGGAGERR